MGLEELSIAKRKITGRVAEAGGDDGHRVWRTDSLRGERKEDRVQIQWAWSQEQGLAVNRCLQPGREAGIQGVTDASQRREAACWRRHRESAKVGSLERGLGATLTSGWMRGHKEGPSWRLREGQRRRPGL